MRNIEILEKARKLRNLGLNCLDGIIALQGKDKAEQIIDLLLEANQLGWNVADLNDIFTEWQGSPKQEESPIISIDDSQGDTISVKETTSVKTILNGSSIFNLIKTKFKLNFDVENSFDTYTNPYRKDSLIDIEDMLLSLGFPPVLAVGILGGSHLTKEFKFNSFEFFEERSNNAFNMTTRTHFNRTPELKKVLLSYIEKYLNSNHTKIDTTPNYESLIDWLNRKYPIVDEIGGVDITWTPLSERKIYSFILNEIQSVWVGSMYNQEGNTENLPCAFDQEVVSNGLLNTTNGVCELIYRDSITKCINEMATKDMDFLKYEGTIKKICENRGTTYTSALGDDIYRFITNLKVGGSKPKIVMSGLKPIHYLLVLVCANYYLSNRI